MKGLNTLLRQLAIMVDKHMCTPMIGQFFDTIIVASTDKKCS